MPREEADAAAGQRSRLGLPTLAYDGGLASELQALRWMLLGTLVLCGAVIAASWTLSHLLEAVIAPLGDLAFGRHTCSADDAWFASARVGDSACRSACATSITG